MKMKVEGLKELQASLDQIAKRSTQTAVMRRALTKAAEPMRAKAEALAPTRSGRLKESIKVSKRTVGEAGAAAYARSMRESGGDKAASVKAMRDARRAAKASGINPPVQIFLGPDQSSSIGHLVEFGSGPRFQKTTGQYSGIMPPRPFMRPAWDSEAKATVARIAPMLRAEIDKAVARAAKRAAKGK